MKKEQHTQQTRKIKLSDDQIEVVADRVAHDQSVFIDEDLGVRWIFSHAFQLGAKFYRDFMACDFKE
jgi:hypothetical protein